MSFVSADYELIREGCRSSAQALVPILDDLLKPSSVLDVGGGEGYFAREFERRGVRVTTVDGPGSNADIVCDLELGLPQQLERADVVLCLEVAEHLSERAGERLVSALCTHAVSAVVFSAAIPGQGGIGHINERWPDYWEAQFEDRGLFVTGDLRWRIWDDQRIENWYRQNLLVASRVKLADLSFGPVLSVVHPVLFDARRDNR